MAARTADDDVKVTAASAACSVRLRLRREAVSECVAGSA